MSECLAERYFVTETIVMSDKLTVVTDDSFEEDVLNVKDTPVLVDFWAEWCGPCRALAPVLDATAEEIGDRIKFAKIDIDNNTAIAHKYGIRSIPTLLLFKNGEIADKTQGQKSKSQLMAFLEPFISE